MLMTGLGMAVGAWLQSQCLETKARGPKAGEGDPWHQDKGSMASACPEWSQEGLPLLVSCLGFKKHKDFAEGRGKYRVSIVGAQLCGFSKNQSIFSYDW